MRTVLLLLGCFIFSNVKAQIFPYQDLFFWSSETIKKNEITQIDGYEFEFFEDSLFTDSIITLGIHQTEEYFDTLGRVTQKINHYPYSDAGNKKRTIHYDVDGHVKSYFHYTKEDLMRAELYEWKNGKLENWRISVPTDKGLRNFVKEIIRDNSGKETLELLKKGKKVLSKDSISYSSAKNYNSRVKKNSVTKEVVDSIIEYKTFGDTTFKKEIYEKGLLVYRELVWKTDNELTQRIEEYQNDEFYKVYYRRSVDGQVRFEKQIHLIPNLNFEKRFYYSGAGLPIKKEIYRNESVPESVIYYLIKIKE